MLVLPLLLVSFRVLDFVAFFNYWIDATHLANEGARFAAVNNNPNTSGTLQAYIQQQGDAGKLRNSGTASVPTLSRFIPHLQVPATVWATGHRHRDGHVQLASVSRRRLVVHGSSVSKLPLSSDGRFVDD